MRKKLIRKNLISARKSAEYTQVELAKKLGITDRQYRSLETGTSNGSIKVWEKLKSVLHVESIDFLLEQEIKSSE